MAEAKSVTITVDGKQITAPAGTLLIEACKAVGIEVPSFCYYPGLSLQAACRMCLVRIEKMPKLQTACTVPITDGMVVTTDSDEVRQARKSMIELLLGNHPLDCPVCDAGGECELQDMTFKYGAAESRYMEGKLHKEEQQWSPVVYFDRPRCILCYRCVRVCGEGMDVWALGIQNRGSGSVIAPNRDDHLECEECGMCIDICPVGALTSGAYRYKTRPWEMNHVGTICTHCGDGCKTTLGVRRSDTGMDIVRGDNRDKSGINGDFLCIKGRYAFDYFDHPARLRQPMLRKNGQLTPVTWEEAIDHAGKRLREIRDSKGGQAIGVIGSNRTTNEENYLLQKFARTVLGTNNIDHHRTADFAAFARAVAGKQNATATMREVFSAPAILLIGNDPTEQHPLLAWNIRSTVRLNRAKLTIVNSQPIKLRRQASAFLQIPAGREGKFIAFLNGDDAAAGALTSASVTNDALKQAREQLKAQQNLIIIFGSELRGTDVAALVKFGAGINAKFICLGDYANSRGAADMGLFPDLLPGYTAIAAGQKFSDEWGVLPPTKAMSLSEMMDAAKLGTLAALYVVGSNPVADYSFDPDVLKNTFVVAQELFLTETASLAEVVLPAASAYEKAGTFTNTCGDLQLLKKAGDLAGVRSDFEIIVRVAERMGADIHKLVPFGGGVRADMGQTRGAQSGEADRHSVWLAANNLEPRLSPFDSMAILDEIQRLVPGYQFSRLNLLAGGDEHVTAAEQSRAGAVDALVQIVPGNDTLFTSGTLGRYSKTLNSVIENRRANPVDKEVMAD
ncbi:MAG TPA: NADH-quinone oxidoreductase subunit NuoG [Candidatus Acidoferrales bacterium]|jgi:NADH-quinone oxidoreductase subunit G|nr:NADH-quinone oxidoreductase subunit NuoG [Candidatus Acidoferrales bacterium]